jgi:hypothetical protein
MGNEMGVGYMERRSFAITIAFGLILTGIMALISMNVGGEGPVMIHPHMDHSTNYPGLLQGQIIKYNWSTDNQDDTVDFHIMDSLTGILENYQDISNRTGEFTVPANENYTLNWYNDNPAGTVYLTFSVEIKDPPAVEELDLTVVTSFSENPCLQGNTTILNITITNPNLDQVRIEEIKAHFDFFPSGIYVEKEGDLSKILGTDQSFYWDLDIEVDPSATPGVHTNDIKIGFNGRIMGNWYPRDWLSGNLSDFTVFEMDLDHDGRPDSKDAFPVDPTEWNDTDSDGRGDNSDKFPLDPLDWNDTDNDGVGDNKDMFPSDPLEWNDTDNDGYGDNRDKFRSDPDEWNDTDDDGVGDNSDLFPADPAASIDTDYDGYPDRWNLGKTALDSTTGLTLDVYPYDNSEWNDTDSDEVADNSDDFPTDPAASIDTDGDGYPDRWNYRKTALDSTTGLTLDAFPLDPLEWIDTDFDGVGDNSDKFPTDPAASKDTDRDGYPDVWNPGKTAEDSTSGLKIDDYPVDATKYEKEEEESSLIILLLIVLILIIIFMIILIPIIAIIFVITALNRKKRSKEGSEERSEE